MLRCIMCIAQHWMVCDSCKYTQILTSTRHPDDAWKALAQLQHAAREALSVPPKQAKASHAPGAGSTENGTGTSSATSEICPACTTQYLTGALSICGADNILYSSLLRLQ